MLLGYATNCALPSPPTARQLHQPTLNTKEAGTLGCPSDQGKCKGSRQLQLKPTTTQDSTVLLTLRARPASLPAPLVVAAEATAMAAETPFRMMRATATLGLPPPPTSSNRTSAPSFPCQLLLPAFSCRGQLRVCSQGMSSHRAKRGQLKYAVCRRRCSNLS